MQYIELRSDTFTKPTSAMLKAMFDAEVGDDVFEECHTTIALEKKCATLFGDEAALFCVSGTMANQIGIKAHTQPGDEVICDELSHVYLYEGGGIATNSLASVQLLRGDRGRITSSQIEEVIKQDNIHYPVSRMVSLENTVNKGGGCCYEKENLIAIKSICQKNNLKLHLDGARIFNAIVAKNESPSDYGNIFDSISICLSKGLGTPMGSVLLGNANFIKLARRIRKRMGGGWRQSGYMAAAGIFALDNHVERLSHDHVLAKELAEVFEQLPTVKSVLPVETNIVIFELNEENNANDFVQKMAELGIMVSPFGSKSIRLVTHLDVPKDAATICKQRLRAML